MGKEPACLLFGRKIRSLGGDTLKEGIHGDPYFGVALVDLFRRIAVAQGRARHGDPILLVFDPKSLKPVPQLEGRDTIFSVVLLDQGANHGSDRARIPNLQSELDNPSGV